MKQRNMAVTIAFALLKAAILILILVILFSFGKKAYGFGYSVFSDETVSDPPGKKVAVTIEDDDITISELADLLKSKRLIKDARVFWVQYQLSEYKDKLKSGNFILNTSQTSEEMLAQLSGEAETESETSE